jgi:serine protease Do
VIARDPTIGLALLQVDSIVPDLAAIRSGPPVRVGDEVVTFGFPLGSLLAADGSLSIGIVNALAGLANDTRSFQISVPIQPGNSGGALIDRSGNVIGVITGTLVSRTASTAIIGQNINFAIKASAVLAFLDEHRVLYKTALSSARLELQDVADRARNFTLMIECLKKQPSKRGKTRGTGMIIRFPRRHESDSLRACRLPTSMAFHTPI